MKEMTCEQYMLWCIAQNKAAARKELGTSYDQKYKHVRIYAIRVSTWLEFLKLVWEGLSVVKACEKIRLDTTTMYYIEETLKRKGYQAFTKKCRDVDEAEFNRLKKLYSGRKK